MSKEEQTILDMHLKAKLMTKEIPFDVWRIFFGAKTTVEFLSDQIGFVNHHCSNDYASLEEFRRALEWFVTQFGGKVTWNTTKAKASPNKEPQSEK